jgi:hypothetical protein
MLGSGCISTVATGCTADFRRKEKTMPPNSPSERILDTITAYDRLKVEGEKVTAADLDLETEVVDEAITLHRTATRLRKALAAIESALGEQLADVLGDGGAVRYGDTIYRYAKGWKETVVDPETFWATVRMFDGKGDLRIEDLFNPDTVRKGALPDAIRDTAFVKTRDLEPTLKAVPIDRAPAFLRDELDDGDYTLGRRI